MAKDIEFLKRFFGKKDKSKIIEDKSESTFKFIFNIIKESVALLIENLWDKWIDISIKKRIAYACLFIPTLVLLALIVMALYICIALVFETLYAYPWLIILIVFLSLLFIGLFLLVEE